jgi:lactose/L-arabinose transport system substrate-binding protein
MTNPLQGPLSRRQVLRLLGMTSAGVAIVACVPAAPAGLSSGSTTEAASTAVPAAIPTGEAAGEVVIWDRSGDLFQVFDATIKSFNEKYPNITVRHEPVDVDTKLAPTLTTGVEVPDGSFILDANIPGLEEYFYDISDWIAPYTADIAPYKLRANTSSDGRVVGIPFDTDPGLLFYRADLVEEAGIDINSIETYDDLLAAAITAQEVLGPDVKPIHIERAGWGIPVQLEMFANQQGTSLMNEDGELMLDSEPYRRAVSWIESVVDAGVGSVQEYMSPGDIAALDGDQVLFYPWGIWFVYGPEQLLESSKGKWRATSLPAWEEGGARGANMGGSSFVIPKDAKNPYLAWLWYEHLMLSPEGYKAVYGPNDIYPGGLNTSLPAYIPAQQEQLFENPEGLGGQNLWETARATVAEIPENYYNAPWFGQAGEIISSNIQQMQDGVLTADEAITNAASEIQSRVIGRQ